MNKYLDPKADVIFKKVFGNSVSRCRSFLNALLPLSEDEQIVDLEYLPAELVPDTPVRKNSIVDVRCRDKNGRQFIVEMQMQWQPEFEQRVLFNACKTYSAQLKKRERYDLLEPVYALSLVNQSYKQSLPQEFVHTYEMNNVQHVNDSIKGLSLTFVELPKFRPETFNGKRMAALWLRFMTEVGEEFDTLAPELLEDPEISEALEVVERAAMTEQELYNYDKFWDAYRVEQALIHGSLKQGREKGYAEGKEEGIAEGMQKGIAEGMQKGEAKGRIEEKLGIARNLKKIGLPTEQIVQITSLTAEEIDKL